MKKLYYFYRSKLRLTEFKNYKKSFFTYFSISVFLFSIFLFGGYSLISSLTSSKKDLSDLKDENKILREKITQIVSEYKNLDEELSELRKKNDDLRIAANLPPVSDEERMVGVGGGYIDNEIDFLTDRENLKLKEAINYVDEVSRKIDFEKSLYKDISEKIKENEKLYAAMPAIKPANGSINNGFGMRMHPILHLMKMHDGLDISVDIGSPVYSTGAGVVDFVGYKGGYGLAIQIDHGFGYRTLYAHLSSSKVKVGSKVSRGDLIAKSGNSGLSSGPHVHYEVEHDGIKQDPSEFFFDDFGFFELTKNNKKKL